MKQPEKLDKYVFRKLEKNDIKQTVGLFNSVFTDDSYYADCKKCKSYDSDLEVCVDYCINSGYSYGAFPVEKPEKLIGFQLVFDYLKAKQDKEIFSKFFDENGEIGTCIKRIFSLIEINLIDCEYPSDKILYQLSIGVSEEYREQGIAGELVHKLQADNIDSSVVSDVSSAYSLPLYYNHGFEVCQLDENKYYPDYNFVIYKPIKLLIPTDCKYSFGSVIHSQKKKVKSIGNFENIAFTETNDDKSISCSLITISYYELLEYQRYIGINNFEEIIDNGVYYYVKASDMIPDLPGKETSANDALSEMLEDRKSEWSIVPDIFVCVPVKIDKNFRLTNIENREILNKFDTSVKEHLKNDFRKIINSERLDFIKIAPQTVQIYDESYPYNEIGTFDMDMLVIADKKTQCGVFIMFALSLPVLVSQFADSVIADRASIVISDNNVVSLNKFAENNGITFYGAPKICGYVPYNTSRLSESEKAALIAGELIYPAGKSYGNVISEEIMQMLKKKYGLGLYDRAVTYCYENTIWEFESVTFKNIKERLDESAITVAYAVVALLEDSAIYIANERIVKLLDDETDEDKSKNSDLSKKEFMESIEEIELDYSKAMDFWCDIPLFTTSKKSLEIVRKGFKISEHLDIMMRNKAQLGIIGDNKFNIMDLEYSEKTERPLLLISVLSVFSALIDSYDYISVWPEILSAKALFICKVSLLITILLVAVAAFRRIAGSKKRKNKKK